MRIAYIISAYKDPQQLRRLIDALDQDADFYIHIDKRIDIEPFKKVFIARDNVFFSATRFFINWGGYAQVLFQRELLRCAIESKKKYTRIVCLSGMDYPLWSNDKIQNEFNQNFQKEYIAGMNISACTNKGQRSKIGYYHFFRDLPIENALIKKYLKGVSMYLMKLIPIRKKLQVKFSGKMVDVYMGSDYWALTYECAKYVYEKMIKEAELMNYFKHSFVPSEMCVQTIVFNSEYRDNAILFASKEYNGLFYLTPLHHIDYGKIIKIFDESDYDRLVSHNKMFFRKAETGISERLLQLINSYRGSQIRI